MVDAAGSKSIDKKRIIYFDGHCPMCSAFVSTIEAREQNVDCRDIHAQSLPESLTFKEVEKEIHVIDSNGVVYKNAAAILLLLEYFPVWKHFTWIGRLWGVRFLLTAGYNVVAKNRYLLFGQAGRLYWLKQVALIGLLSSMLLSWPLWVRTGVVPSVPILSFLPMLPSVIEILLLATVFVTLLASVVAPNPNRYLGILLGVLAILIAFDQLRLQPWLYQYWWMLLGLVTFSWSASDKYNIRRVSNYLQIVVAAIYFYSGLQKVTIPFFTQSFPWMVEPIVSVLPTSLQLVPVQFGLAVPFIEMAIGVGLLTKKYRQFALVGVLCMLVFVLTVLGPFGHNWNTVVWPWNIALAMMAFILFYKSEFVPIRDLVSCRYGILHIAVVCVFAIAPLLSFVNLWDSYPSYSLYSGNVDRADIFVWDSVHVDDRLKIVMEETGKDYQRINLQTLSYADRNVPMYPEARVYRAIFNDFCTGGQLPNASQLVVLSKTSLTSDAKVSRVNCVDGKLSAD